MPFLDKAGLTRVWNKIKNLLSGKQDTISDLSTIRSNASAGAAKVSANNATITFKRNGTLVKAITTNQSTNETIDIIVPTSASDVGALPSTATAGDVGALPSSTKYAASIAMSINTTTYVVTLTLKDQDGNTLGTAQTIDLPLESVVVSGSYESNTQKVVLTLKDGSTIKFSVADLVSGLYSKPPGGIPDSDLAGSTETWTLTLDNGTTVTKKIRVF